MPKMAVMGEKSAILGFKALGVNVFAVNNALDAEATLRKLAIENYAAIFITEQFAAELSVQIREIEKTAQLYPSIVIIPGPGENRGLGMNKIKNMVEKALGMAIFSTPRE